MNSDMEELRAYLEGPFKKVEGWCIAHLWQAIEPLRSAMKGWGPDAPVAEIGVFHGKFFIGLVKTMQAAASNTAIDVFDLQQFNLDKAGEGDLARFHANLAMCGVPSEAVTAVRADSMSLARYQVEDIRRSSGGYSMFSVDGCHLVEHTINDIHIAMELTLPHGIIFVDDYYNANWPGVQEGVAKLYLTESPRFVPLLFTCNKLFLCNISHHGRYLRAVTEHVRQHHPTTRIKSVRRFGYDTLTLTPNLLEGAPLSKSE